MTLISVGILVLMSILVHDPSGHYNRLALISLDIISGVYCIRVRTHSMPFASPWMMMRQEIKMKFCCSKRQQDLHSQSFGRTWRRNLSGAQKRRWWSFFGRGLKKGDYVSSSGGNNNQHTKPKDVCVSFLPFLGGDVVKVRLFGLKFNRCGQK